MRGVQLLAPCAARDNPTPRFCTSGWSCGTQRGPGAIATPGTLAAWRIPAARDTRERSQTAGRGAGPARPRPDRPRSRPDPPTASLRDTGGRAQTAGAGLLGHAPTGHAPMRQAAHAHAGPPR